MAANDPEASRTRPKISPARLSAAATLAILHQDSTAQALETLSAQTMRFQVASDDQRLARTLVYGVLRRALALDFFYQSYLSRKSGQLQGELQILLRLAAFQQYELTRIPAYAIVNETVELARHFFKLKPQQVGFVNAVVRKIVSGGPPTDLPSGDRTNALSVRYSMPGELVAMMVKQFGVHRAIQLLEQCNTEPPMVLRVNRLRTDGETLASKLAETGYVFRPGEMSPDALVSSATGDGSLFDTPEFEDGQFYVQDEASQLIAHIARPVRGESILDMCSAPGGKTTHMAELTGGEADITATDLSETRLEMVWENVQRLQTPGVQIQRMADVLASDSQYDLVMVDAPCSGLGTIRRNPEIRYRVNAAALERHAERQLATLSQSAPRVKPGGRLVYSTCSFAEQENRTVIERFLSDNAAFEIVSDPGHSLCGDDGYYRTWPMHPQVDGFTAVVLRKRV